MLSQNSGSPGLASVNIRLLGRIVAVVLSLFLTVPCAFSAPAVDGFASAPAATAPVNKRAMVEAAYENFVSTLYFLSASDRFRTSLVPDETQQFEILGRILMPN